MKFAAKIFFFALSSCLFVVNGVVAAIRLPTLFSNNMVLQQNAQVTFWGWADPGEAVEIKVGWSPKPLQATANKNGEWQLAATTPGADHMPYSIIFKGENSIELKNVLLGEVWLASGQSNMEFPVAPSTTTAWQTGVIDFQKEIAQANYPKIRMFTVAHTVADEPQADVKGVWQICDTASVNAFSAVAYFFAREVQEKTGLPIGIIHSSWGGTPLESWTKKEVLESDADYKPILERYTQALQEYPQAFANYQQELAQWKEEAAEAKANGTKPKPAPREPIGPRHFQSPSKLYNGMIAPLIPFAIRGVVWYQGEQNAARAYQYRQLFPAMIKSWRDEWKRELPFYFAQIAPHRSQNPEIREAQLLTMQSAPKTGMAVLTDAGDSLDIHPRNKQVVGKRLALWALANEYNQKEVVFSGPIYKSMQVKGDKIYLTFSHVNGGLQARGGPLAEFTIAAEDQVFMPASATIVGNTIAVSHKEIKKPVAVRFAWSHVPKPNLYNKAGLPASPFRTDSWPGVTEGKN